MDELITYEKNMVLISYPNHHFYLQRGERQRCERQRCETLAHIKPIKPGNQ